MDQMKFGKREPLLCLLQYNHHRDLGPQEEEKKKKPNSIVLKSP